MCCCCFITHLSKAMIDPERPGILHSCITRIMKDFSRKIAFDVSFKQTISKYRNEKVCIFSPEIRGNQMYYQPLCYPYLTKPHLIRSILLTNIFSQTEKKNQLVQL